MECTFNRTPGIRGPRSLRPKTIKQIYETQQQGTAQSSDKGGAGTGFLHQGVSGASPSTSTTVDDEGGATGGAFATSGSNHADGTPAAALVLRLCIYRLRLFPVWPIVAVEEVMAALQQDPEDRETYALANAIGAATMAQLKLDRSRHAEINDTLTAHDLEAECRRALRLAEDSFRGAEAAEPNLNTLRTSFFLHIYHENQRPGGPKSLLYLREAITLAQVMGLHRPSSYPLLPPPEQRMRRRILALLFVTERGVAMLHKLPVVLTSINKLPPLDGTDGGDDAKVLPAFQNLVKLFWVFDQSGAFDIICAVDSGDYEVDAEGGSSMSILEKLQKRLEELSFDAEPNISDVQKADICVTRQWMQVLLWRAVLQRKIANGGGGDDDDDSLNVLAVSEPEADRVTSRPIQIASEFLDIISRLPNTALEAHGPTMEFKIYEIASAVTDVIASRMSLPKNAQVVMDVRPNDILLRLQKMLAVSRGGNMNLLAALCARIAHIDERPPSRELALPDARRPNDELARGVVTNGDAGVSVWPETQLSTRIVSPGESQVRAGEISQLSALSPLWLSLLALTELQASSTQLPPDDAHTNNHDRHSRSSQDQESPGRILDESLAAELSWHPLAFMEHLGAFGTGSGGDARPASGLDALGSMPDNWFSPI